VNKARIEKTCSLPLHTNFFIAQTAYAAGFNNIAYFNRRFKSEAGTSPLEYRKKMR
jgi:YesN/AraC family two-component response regulator